MCDRVLWFLTSRWLVLSESRVEAQIFSAQSVKCGLVDDLCIMVQSAHKWINAFLLGVSCAPLCDWICYCGS